MSEVTRFRLTRSPQRAVLPAERTLSLSETPTTEQWRDGPSAPENAAAWLAGRALLAPARRFTTPDLNNAAALQQVRWLDEQLARRGNATRGADLAQDFADRLDGTAASIAQRWGALRSELSEALIACVLAGAEPALGQDVQRLLLVIGLVELAAEHADLEAEAVAAALRARVVFLPPWVLRFARHSRLARVPAISDLYIVRDEWSRFELGEIAHIENVVQGEKKSRLVERTEEEETTTTIDEASARLEERDTQTTDRFELRQESQRDVDLALHVEGGLDVSAQYGMAKINAHAGAEFDYSVEESSKRAVTQARESVARAVTRIEETVRRQRATRALTRMFSSDQHGLDNAQGQGHVVAIYRWVDKIKTVQVFRYPNRLLFEFEVPEPGAFIRWSHGRPTTPRSLTPFTVDGELDGAPLTAGGITAGATDVAAGVVNYRELARRYAAQGLEPPPEEEMVFASVPLPQDPGAGQTTNPPPVYATTTATIPDGAEGYRFTIYAVASNGVPEGPGLPTGWLEIVVGTDFPSQTATDDDPGVIWRFQGTNVFRGLRSMDFRTPITGQVPIQLGTDDTNGMLATVQIFCRPTASTMATWAEKTFDLIQGAYYELVQDAERAAEQESVRAGITIQGASPTRNAEVVREEMKRSVVELLRGERFDGLPATAYPTDGSAPRIDLDANDRTASEIQFLEQALEWENLSFVLYPYFWADAGRWAALQSIDSADADFDRFLRAGSARVVVPARPGFEAQVHLYTLFGTLWGGGPAPAPDDPLYLSIADEIRAMQRAPADGVPDEHWEVRLPTTLVYLSPLGTTVPLANTSATLPLEPPIDDGGVP